MERFGAGALTARYDAALKFASDAHREQMRKNGDVPYLSHLLRVSGLTLDYGGSENAAIAALLHDVVEDCGGTAALERVRVTFGDEVATIVLDVSDSTTIDAARKAPWRERKEAYLARLERCGSDALLVAACDKLDNATSLLRTLNLFESAEILSKFKANPKSQIWYYDSVLEILAKRRSPVADELSLVVERLRNVLTNFNGVDSDSVDVS